MRKKRAGIYLVACSIACLGLLNCSKNDSSPRQNTPSPTTQATPTPTPAPVPQISSWKFVQERTQCEAMNPANCQGAYGFTVTSSGSYSVGPSASGQTASGRISNRELAKLKADAEAVVRTSSVSTCQAGSHLPGSADAVVLVLNDNSFFSPYSHIGTTGQTCYRGAQAFATALHDDLHALMVRYYPTNFP